MGKYYLDTEWELRWTTYELLKAVCNRKTETCVVSLRELFRVMRMDRKSWNKVNGLEFLLFCRRWKGSSTVQKLIGLFMIVKQKKMYTGIKVCSALIKWKSPFQTNNRYFNNFETSNVKTYQNILKLKKILTWYFKNRASKHNTCYIFTLFTLIRPFDIFTAIGEIALYSMNKSTLPQTFN